MKCSICGDITFKKFGIRNGEEYAEILLCKYCEKELSRKKSACAFCGRKTKKEHARMTSKGYKFFHVCESCFEKIKKGELHEYQLG